MNRKQIKMHADNMKQRYFRVIMIFCSYLSRKIDAQTTVQTCSCVPLNTCFQSLTSSDGSGVIDIRMNDGNAAVSPRASATCAIEMVPCCTPDSGCGVRYAIPITPETTPAEGQARYGGQPWEAVILGTDNTYVGGGVLLDSFHVLTVAHKFINRTKSSIKILMGEWNANQAVEPYPIQEVGVNRITRHPNFSSDNLYNDIAILRLSTPIIIGPNPAINTACLPSATQNFENLRCIVHGWGKDAFSGYLQSIVKVVPVTVTDSYTCQNQLRSTKLGLSFVLNTASFLCAGGEAYQDACVGDGGSPLMCNIGGKYQVAGLVSWGIGCGAVSVPGVYVRVQSFIPWIEQNLN